MRSCGHDPIQHRHEPPGGHAFQRKPRGKCVLARIISELPACAAPTSASWLNAVEGFFAKLSKRRLKRGVFRSVVDLQAAINRFVEDTNQMPKPFTWTADPDKIIAAVRRGHQVLDSIHYFQAAGYDPE